MEFLQRKTESVHLVLSQGVHLAWANRQQAINYHTDIAITRVEANMHTLAKFWE